MGLHSSPSHPNIIAYDLRRSREPTRRAPEGLDSGINRFLGEVVSGDVAGNRNRLAACRGDFLRHLAR